MTAKDAINPSLNSANAADIVAVGSAMPLGMLIDRMVDMGSDVVAVTDDEAAGSKLLGYADALSALRLYARLFPQLQESTELTVLIPARQYSASSIARAVEDADAHLLNLNVVEGTTADCVTTAEIRVNHSRGESVARSLERYGYEVTSMTLNGRGTLTNDTTANRARALLHYLDI